MQQAALTEGRFHQGKEEKSSTSVSSSPWANSVVLSSDISVPKCGSEANSKGVRLPAVILSFTESSSPSSTLELTGLAMAMKPRMGTIESGCAVHGQVQQSKTRSTTHNPANDKGELKWRILKKEIAA